MNNGRFDNKPERMLFRVEEPATIAPKTCSGESKKSIDGDNGTCETKRRANEAVTETPDESNTSGPERYVPEQTSNTAASTTDPNRSGKRKNTLGLMERVVERCPIVQKKILKPKRPEPPTTPDKKKAKMVIPKTPDYYWETSYPTIEQQIERGWLVETTSPWKQSDGTPYKKKDFYF